MQDLPKTPNFEENARILDRIRIMKGWKVRGAGAKLADLFGVTESVISNWKTRTDIDLALVRRKLTSEEFAYATGGPIEEPETARDRHPGYNYKTGLAPSTTEKDLWLARETVENALRSRRLFEMATEDQKVMLVDYIARGLANGESPESLRRGLQVSLDLVEDTYRKAHE